MPYEVVREQHNTFFAYLYPLVCDASDEQVVQVAEEAAERRGLPAQEEAAAAVRDEAAAGGLPKRHWGGHPSHRLLQEGAARKLITATKPNLAWSDPYRPIENSNRVRLHFIISLEHIYTCIIYCM